jgi:hypothetical protein
MLKILGAALTALCVLFVAIPAYAVELILGPAATPWEECRQAIYDDEEITNKAWSPQEGSEEGRMFRDDLLALCDLLNPLNESWSSLHQVIVNGERTGDRDGYLARLGVTMETLEAHIQKVRIFSARQAYARLYGTMHWQQPSGLLPEYLYNLYGKYGDLLDPSKPYDRRYGEVFDKAAPESFIEIDKLFGLDASVTIGKDLKCAGFEPYLGWSGYEISIICRINEWPPPVYPLVGRDGY